MCSPDVHSYLPQQGVGRWPGEHACTAQATTSNISHDWWLKTQVQLCNTDVSGWLAVLLPYLPR
jgi:hypothetical protein